MQTKRDQDPSPSLRGQLMRRLGAGLGAVLIASCLIVPTAAQPGLASGSSTTAPDKRLSLKERITRLADTQVLADQGTDASAKAPPIVAQWNNWRNGPWNNWRNWNNWANWGNWGNF